MSNVITYQRFWQRRDTAANWTSVNPKLASGEFGYETDTGKLKLGDGTTAWTSLGYMPSTLADPGADRLLFWDDSAGKYRFLTLGTGLTISDTTIDSIGGSGSDPDATILRTWELLEGFTTSTAIGTSFVTSAGMPVVYLQNGTAAYQVEAGRPGMVRLGTGGSAAGYARMFYTPGLLVKFGGGVIRFRQPIRIPTLSTGTQRFNVLVGFANVINGAGLQRLQAYYEDSVNSGKWVLRAQDGSGTTDSNSTIAPVAGATSNIEIQVNAAGTSASLYVDDILAATVAANIPTVALAPSAWLTKTIGTTAVNLDLLGYAEYEETFTTPR